MPNLEFVIFLDVPNDLLLKLLCKLEVLVAIPFEYVFLLFVFELVPTLELLLDNDPNDERPLDFPYVKLLELSNNDSFDELLFELPYEEPRDDFPLELPYDEPYDDFPLELPYDEPRDELPLELP